jgi:hypothetical protein
MPTAEETTAQTLLLVQAQSSAREQIRQLTVAQVVAEIRLFRAWYDHDAITAFAGRLAKIARSGQKQTAISTDAYAARVLKVFLGRGRPVGPVPVAELRAVPLESVYGRLADEFRYLEATRGPDAPAALLERRRDDGVLIDPFPRLTREAILDRVVLRGEVQTGDNLTLAMTHQWQADIEDVPQVTGFRRVLHPELSQGGSCGLCVAASTRLYSKAELLPVHARCACTVTPVIGDEDPGGAINARDLKALYAKAGSTAAADLKRVRVVESAHGELGPRLSFAGHNVRTEADAERDDLIPGSAS